MATIGYRVILVLPKMAAGSQKMIWGISDIFEHVDSSVDDTNTI